MSLEDYYTNLIGKVAAGGNNIQALVDTQSEVVDSIKGAAIVVFLLFTLLFRVVGVDGVSMSPTLSDGDWVAVNGVVSRYEYGDIIVITQPWEKNVPIIKRVIAVGGQTVDIDFKTGTVYVDGAPLKEDYLGSPTLSQYDVEFPLYIPQGNIFVLGDNRMESLDSRSSRIGNGGIIDNRYVLGHAIYRFFPFNKIGELD
jgi:signal peptidase I